MTVMPRSVALRGLSLVLLAFLLHPARGRAGLIADMRARIAALEERLRLVERAEAGGVDGPSPATASPVAEGDVRASGRGERHGAPGAEGEGDGRASETPDGAGGKDREALEARIARIEGHLERSIPVRRSSKSNWDLRLGGRVFNDWISPRGDASLETLLGEFHSSSLFRKARIFVKGFHEDFDFKFEVDFADGDADFTDTYIQLPAPGPLRWRVGRQKEPAGMENVGSSRFLTFMERASVCETLVPKRNTGVSLSDERSGPGPGWRIGYFRNANSYGVETGEGGHNLSGRWHFMPLFRDEGRDYAHLGVSVSHRVAGSGSTTYNLLTGTRLVDPFATTGPLDVDDSDVFGLQFVRTRGPVSFFGEVAETRLDMRGGVSASLWGAYLAVTRMLTGEHRPFDTSRGSFDRVLPRRPYAKGRGGAWELALRWSVLDLVDGEAGIDGGRLDEWTLGCNWYLNANTRVTFDYMRPELEGAGRADFLQMRFQVDF